MTPILDTASTPDADVLEHRYNDDLLLEPDSRRHAEAEFPQLFHVLDNEELRAAFRPIDDAAGAAKRNSRRAGICAVALAVLSLGATSAEPLWHELPPPWPSFLAILAAVFGLAAAAIATAGVLYGRHKKVWLLNRFRTERLRQYYFQAFIWELPRIAGSCDASRPTAMTDYGNYRAAAVAEFAYHLQGHVEQEFEAVTGPAGGERLWLYPATDSPPDPPAAFDCTPLFKAYRKLRLEEQLGYAVHKIGRSTFARYRFWESLRHQRESIALARSAGIALLILLHAILLLEFAAGAHIMNSSILHVAIVWSALVALGAKTLEDGLGLARDVERYEDYAAVIADALRRFDHTTSPKQRFGVMMELERAAFEEMRSFLRSSSEASFVF